MPAETAPTRSGGTRSQTSFSRPAPGASVSIAVRSSTRSPTTASPVAPGKRSTIPATCTGTEAPPICSGSCPPTPPASSASLRVTRTDGGDSSVGCRGRRNDVRASVSGARTTTPPGVVRTLRPPTPIHPRSSRASGPERRSEPMNAIPASAPRSMMRGGGTSSSATRADPRGARASIVDAERGFADPTTMRRNVPSNRTSAASERRLGPTRKRILPPGSGTPRCSTGRPGSTRAAS